MATVPAPVVLLLVGAHAIIPLDVAVGSLVGDEEELVTEKVWASRAAMVGPTSFDDCHGEPSLPPSPDLDLAGAQRRGRL